MNRDLPVNTGLDMQGLQPGPRANTAVSVIQDSALLPQGQFQGFWGKGQPEIVRYPEHCTSTEKQVRFTISGDGEVGIGDRQRFCPVFLAVKAAAGGSGAFALAGCHARCRERV